MQKNKHKAQIQKLYFETVPLGFLAEDQFLGYRYGRLCRCWIGQRKIEPLAKLPDSRLRHAFSYLPILARRFGLNEIKAARLDRERFLIHYHRTFFVFSPESGELKPIPADRMAGANGSVLYLTATASGVLFGDYGYNPQKKAMGIYRFLPEKMKMEKLWQFEEGTVNHIHNLIEDPVTGRIWIFTGDFGDSAAIYYTDDFFGSLHCIGKGAQRYRSCVGASAGNRLYYATDSPLEYNHLIRWDHGHFTDLCGLNGSCIYGCRKENLLYLSTTVENQTDELHNEHNRYRYNLGNGIKDWYAELIRFDLETEDCEVLLRSRKDLLPMMPFQYGCFRFPCEQGSRNGLICRGQAVRRFHNWTILVHREGGN